MRPREHRRPLSNVSSRPLRVREPPVVHCTVIVPTMPGWNVQWYGNDPAVLNVAVNVAPGAIAPEFQTALSDVDVCAIVSSFVQVTLPPTATAIGLGEYALFAFA